MAYQVIMNWFTDKWEKVENPTKKMEKIFNKVYIPLYNAGCELVNQKLQIWNKEADYLGIGGGSILYERFIANRENEVLTQLDSKKMKLRALIIPEDNCAVMCGICLIEDQRYICVASLKETK